MNSSEEFIKKYEEEWLKRLQQEPPENSMNLDIYDYMILSKYTGYGEVENLFLRENYKDKNFVEDYTDALVNVMNSLPKYEHNEILYRGTQLPPEILDKIIQTKIFKDTGWLSTTKGYHNAMRFPIMTDTNPFRKGQDWKDVFFIINASCNGLALSHFIGIFPLDGYEIIFRPNTAFNVEKIENKMEMRDDNDNRGNCIGQSEYHYTEIILSEIC